MTMSLIRGVLVAGQFRTQHELNEMSHDDQRNTLIVELAAHSNQTNFQSFDDPTLAGMGAVMVFLRAARIRDDRTLKTMSTDDQRNTLIVELDAQTQMGSQLQGLSHLELVLLGLGNLPPHSLSQASFLRGVLLAGQFRTQRELNGMSEEDQRNTLIVELTARSNQSNFQSFNDFELAGMGAVLVFLRGAAIRDDRALKAMSADDRRNTLIVELNAQTRLGARLQGLRNIDLVRIALGVDPESAGLPNTVKSTLKLAVLLVTCKGSPRVTTLTDAWAERATTQVRRYIESQSGGRAGLECRVFEWTPLSFTTAEWMAEGATVGNRVRPEVARAHNADLAGFDYCAIVVDHVESHLAATFGHDILMAAQDFTPAILAHELGHAFGAIHTQLDSPNGPVVYGGPFCIMGAEGGKYSFADPLLSLPDSGSTHAMSGPNMCVPSLLSTKWLDLRTHGVGRSVSADGSIGSIVRIAALDGAPRDGTAGPPVCAYVDAGDRYLLEYRVPQSSWDTGLPDPDQHAAAGWVIAHRTPVNGPLDSLQIGALAAAPGRSIVLGADNPFDLFTPGPLKISVLGFDARMRTVDVSLSRRKARQLPSERSFGGVAVGAGGVVWTPGGGLQPVGPESPLHSILQRLGELETMRLLVSVGGARYAGELRAAAEAALTSLREAVMAVRLDDDEDLAKTLLEEADRLRRSPHLEGVALTEHLDRLRTVAAKIRPRP